MALNELQSATSALTLGTALPFASVYGSIYVLLRQSATGRERKTKHEWCTRVVATLHSMLLFSLTARYWISESLGRRSLQLGSLPARISSKEALPIDVMTGYLAYDSVVMVVESLASQHIDVLMLAHHCLGLMSHLLTRLLSHGPSAFYTMMVFMAEASTPFLHGAWCLHRCGLKNTTSFKATALALLLSFFVFRVLLAPAVLWHLWVGRHAPEWGLSDCALNRLVYSFQFFVTVAFVALNGVWFVKLLHVALGKSAVPGEGKGRAAEGAKCNGGGARTKQD